MTNVKVGQIWQDNDPRFERYEVRRYVRIVRVAGQNVRIKRCYDTGEDRPGSPETATGIERFGKTGTRGFTLVKDAP